jgi:predicted dehydrogenase
VVRLGIVGTNFGRQVLLPAFRCNPRCQVVALAGSDSARTTALARQSDIPAAYGDWRQMIERDDIDAVAIAVPPQLQPEIAIAALGRRKAVFAEKPMAADLAGARAMLDAARKAPVAHMVDYEFTGVLAWQHAESMLDRIGRLRHVSVTWQVENESTRRRIKNWKTNGEHGGGALGNFVSHSAHILEWMCGPITGLVARLSGLPDDPAMETTVTASLAFKSGATGQYAMSCAAYLGSGHRLEFYGEDGTLVLSNTTTDYMRGFTLHYAQRPATTLVPLKVGLDSDDSFPDGRIAPVAQLANRFLGAIEGHAANYPSFVQGFRAQVLLDAMRRSHVEGRWIDTPETPA